MDAFPHSAAHDWDPEPVRGPHATGSDDADLPRDELLRRLAAERRARHRAEQLQLLTAALVGAVTPDEVVDAAMRAGERLVGASGASLAILDEDGGAFTLAASRGLATSVLGDWRRVPNTGDWPWPTVARTGEPLYARTRAEYVARSPALAAVAEALALEAEATLPLRVGSGDDGRVLGVLSLTFAEPHDFDVREDTFLRAVASQCAQALERARLFAAEHVARERADLERAQLARLIDALPVMITLYDPALANDPSGAVTVNRAFTETLGWTQDDARDGDLMARCYPDEAVRAMAVRHMSAPADFWLEIPTTARDGTTHVVQWGNVRLAGDRQVGVGIDRTTEHAHAVERERHLAGVAAERARADLGHRRLAAVLGALPVGVIMVEAPTGRVSYVNDALHRIFGDAPPTERLEAYSVEWVGWHVADGRILDRRYASHEWPIARALLHGDTVLDEVIAARRADGRLVMISVSAAPIRDATGTVVGAAASVADVDAQQRAVHAIEEARLAAEQANQAKSMFLANMSHELRTPLNAIAGHVHLVEMGIHGPVTEAQRTALGRVQRAQHHLLGLINDVLNFAKLQAGSVEFEVRAVAVAEVVADVATLIEPQVAAKGLRFETALPAAAAEAHVFADRDKLVQVLLNLLSNAVKFTPAVRDDGAPGVVRVEVATRSARPELLFVRVRDTGVGIPRDRQQAIFDPFVQVRSGYTRTSEGTGLGLAISRDLARGMGGDVRVRSTEGEGATFTVSLRRAADAGASPPDRRLGSDRRQATRAEPGSAHPAPAAR